MQNPVKRVIHPAVVLLAILVRLATLCTKNTSEQMGQTWSLQWGRKRGWCPALHRTPSEPPGTAPPTRPSWRRSTCPTRTRSLAARAERGWSASCGPWRSSARNTWSPLCSDRLRPPCRWSGTWPTTKKRPSGRTTADTDRHLWPGKERQWYNHNTHL